MPSTINSIPSTEKEVNIKTPSAILITVLATNVLARPHFLAYGQESVHNLSFMICKYLFRAPAYVWTVRKPEQIPAKKRNEGMIFEGFIPED